MKNTRGAAFVLAENGQEAGTRRHELAPQVGVVILLVTVIIGAF